MAGRGDLATPLVFENVWILKPNELETRDNLNFPNISSGYSWVVAKEPFFNDRNDVLPGACLASSFAEEYLKRKPESKIGFICYAIGGSPLSLWEPNGGEMFHNTIELCKKLKGNIKGILWHQGETDATDMSLTSTYCDRFKDTIVGFRNQIGNTELPFIAGEIGRFLADNNRFLYWKEINDAIHKATKDLDKTVVVSSHDLEHKGDITHFDTPSLRELGLRYANSYFSI